MSVNAGQERAVRQDPRVPQYLRPPANKVGQSRQEYLAAKHGVPAPGAPNASEERVLIWEGVPRGEQPTVSTALNMWANLPKPILKEVTDNMNKAYGEGRWSLFGGPGKPGIKGFWEQAVNISRAEAARGNTVSVRGAFNNLFANAEALGISARGAGASGGGGGGGAPRITETVNLTDPGTAQLLVDQALEQYLGRKASEQEVKKFRRALAKAERGAPTRIDIEGSRQTTSGGFNPAAFAQEFARGMEGSAEYQTATTFLDEFMSALGPRVEL